MVKVLFVCLGNICRSPMAEAIFQQKITEKGLAGKVLTDSAGTSDFHIGSRPDPRTIECCINNQTPIEHHARQIVAGDYEAFDFVLAMDRNNYYDIESVFRKEHPNFFLMRDFDEAKDSMDVPDPYFGGMDGFQQVYDMLWRSCDKLIDHIVKEKGL